MDRFVSAHAGHTEMLLFLERAQETVMALVYEKGAYELLAEDAEARWAAVLEALQPADAELTTVALKEFAMILYGKYLIGRKLAWGDGAEKLRRGVKGACTRIHKQLREQHENRHAVKEYIRRLNAWSSSDRAKEAAPTTRSAWKRMDSDMRELEEEALRDKILRKQERIRARKDLRKRLRDTGTEDTDGRKEQRVVNVEVCDNGCEIVKVHCGDGVGLDIGMPKKVVKELPPEEKINVSLNDGDVVCSKFLEYLEGINYYTSKIAAEFVLPKDLHIDFLRLRRDVNVIWSRFNESIPRPPPITDLAEQSLFDS